jgi:hypothetical protein
MPSWIRVFSPLDQKKGLDHKLRDCIGCEDFYAICEAKQEQERKS